jgi:hypothetical protein
METKKRGLVGVAFLLIVTLGFAGCSGKKDSGSSSGGNSGGAVKTASIGSAAPASDFNYDISEDGKGVVIKGYTGKGGKLVIPAEIEGLPVVELGDSAFWGEYNYVDGPGINITSVVIPASVKKVSGNCFLNIEKLTSVTFLGSDVQLGGLVFGYCANLADLKFPDGENILKPYKDETWGVDIVIVSKDAFKGCTKLPLAIRAKLKEWGFTEI